ncbi:unnamed protein product [Cochlearia groenlandica]
MSTTTNIFPPPSPPPPPVQIPTYITSLGLGYSIAIALGFLVLISTIILSSYICCRASRLRFSASTANANANASFTVPRIIFVTDQEEDLESVVGGLEQQVINSYPKFHYTKDLTTTVVSAVSVDKYVGDTACSICLSEYVEEEMLRMMPECKHYFHVACLDTWLKLNGSCPVCRNSPFPTPQSTPQSTPLSEVVPLSQYAADRRRSRR